MELEPASAVRILHTDLAVDILPSEEVEDVVRRRMESDSSFSMSRTNRLQKYKIAKQAASPSPEPSTPSFEEQKVETLPPEAPESEDAITCCIRFPDGTSATRRFMLDDSISNLLHFVRLKVFPNPLFVVKAFSGNECIRWKWNQAHHSISKMCDFARTIKRQISTVWIRSSTNFLCGMLIRAPFRFTDTALVITIS